MTFEWLNVFHSFVVLIDTVNLGDSIGVNDVACASTPSLRQGTASSARFHTKPFMNGITDQVMSMFSEAIAKISCLLFVKLQFTITYPGRKRGLNVLLVHFVVFFLDVATPI